KSSFEALLDERIRDALNLSSSGVTELSYENEADKQRCARLLLLMNTETVRRMEHSTERYSFRLHHSKGWSLEHIHAQHAESLTKAEQWREWLRLHREALDALPTDDKKRRDALVTRIDGQWEGIDRRSFSGLAREVTEFFTREADSNQVAIHSVHSVTNLALLSSGDNSALSNAVFEVKRRRILELDREGAYIPICTRRV